ncbi:hypothetical protein OCV51_10235 [Faecalicatena acetigenes]|uniref:Uncharacterized protein n=1 Tax=Faecalicatena acetigenes TaxID=2981790 RepID=A0ABT2TCM1_9FIRM|nr:hypothetical protein [Faecalicatena acetigenes]MCU6748024.1 hypothetical protein [Faecalicatena acetigenes]SCI22167.1 Uncharacterised protein [uncultured Clostridium sp.]
MEKVQNEEQTIEVFESDIDLYLKLFCEEQNIEDLKTESQSVWNAALMYVKRHVFPTSDTLKLKNNIINTNGIMDSTYNSYNYDLVDNVCDYYIYLCMRYDKEVSAIGFSLLTGIDRYTIATWRDGGNKLSTRSSDIGKKIYDYREESLSNKLVTGKQNPVGVLGVLNRHYAWNLPGVSKERTSERALTASELPKLGEVKRIESEKD